MPERSIDDGTLVPETGQLGQTRVSPTGRCIAFQMQSSRIDDGALVSGAGQLCPVRAATINAALRSRCQGAGLLVELWFPKPATLAQIVRAQSDATL